MFRFPNNLLCEFHRYMTHLLFFLLPLPDRFLSLGMGLWGGSWLLWRISTKDILQLNRNAKIASILFASFVLFNFASAFWGHTPSLGGRLMEHRLSFVILSLVLLIGIYPKFKIKNLVNAYFAGAIGSLILFLITFIYHYFTDSIFKYQLDINAFSAFLADYKHPAYLSLNLVLAFFLFISFNKDIIKSRPIFIVTLYLLIFSCVYFSNSRAGVLNLLLATLFLLFYYGNKHLGLLKTLLSVGGIVIVFSIGITHSSKFLDVLDNSEHVALRAPRKVLWSNAYELFKEKPIVGHGLGSSKVSFVTYCKDNGIYNAEVLNLNTHNQFLELLLESGGLSLVLLFACFLFLYRSNKASERNFVLALFSLIFFSYCFESMLLRIAGVTSFISMVLFVFLLSNTSHTTGQHNHTNKRFVIATGILLVLALCALGLFQHTNSIAYNSYLPDTYSSKGHIVVPFDSLPAEFPVDEPTIYGAKFDYRSEASMWSGNAYMLNRLAKKELNVGEELTSSVYCYVSSDFDGTWVRLSIDQTNGKCLARSNYNLKKKGTWQKLSINVNNLTGEMPAYLYFCKEGVNSFEDLKGYVIFAYPQYTITEKPSEK